ncbi:F-box family protein [Arabidopsis thaliana]|uniref:F-box/kelch-repeat protein KIB1 n=1 Tax=Arabidopsis thaliana TaxID=3702 RepID=KIB1_ARATH|nr:F-box family protein [Arabidopsis thaliana]Q9SU05.1 RecName: Full=F-box/kelch-repeat protein KIB1; AltName: Full=Protein KINK SUPPRESSED IN BZR1-1D 1 [Arabidopsis thaliana]AEE83187.1 F-box family protein [Arabidopsis thaliana]CAB40998.1 putative protein [Arabidopsis thaliana]CAB78323.1 putative protein [Arabidopsis thaliana]|eukprot:NP_193017.1 F-box family protein [Arabidopsis thaliana]
MTHKKQKKEMSDSEKKTFNEDSKHSILAVDLVRLILERLSFVDFHRARCVSSIWYIASKTVIGVTNPTTPWLILFPKGDVEIKKDSCKLYDPHENKTYIVRDLGFDLVTSRCLASSGSWFLMLDHRTEFHLLNLFTRVRIPLPSLESTRGSDIKIGNAVLWVDEQRKDYLVVWNISSLFGYHKKGDDRWKVFKPLENERCIIAMVFKENKLYVLSVDGNVDVFYFSGNDSPVRCATLPSSPLRKGHKVVVTLSGEVLIIVAKVEPYPRTRLCFFAVYKMDPKSSRWETIKSLAGEALILDLGITVEAKVMKNCIYFSNDQFHRYNENSLWNVSNKSGVFVYHFRSANVVQLVELLTASSRTSKILFKDARCFFPTFTSKWLL